VLAFCLKQNLRSSTRNGAPKTATDDGGTIENQILLVQKYIEGKPYLKLCETFIDNGQTGTNFDREGFQNLMDAVKRGKIDCIAVKDLSRFGRDYIETGDYLEKILPFWGVRFISVNDGYDSHDTARSGDILTVALKNLINDIYAKDISRKVKTAFAVKQQKGEYIGGQAPYGYLKSPENKHKLIVNEETAPVVRDIFQWKLDGMSNSAIARKLNNNNVISPSNYLYSKGVINCGKYSKKILWSRDYIKKLLKNPAYIGHIAQGKTKSDLSLGFDRKAQSEDKWIIVNNMHEPIIDLSVFKAVNNIIEKRKQEYNEKQKSEKFKIHENIFTSLLYCSGCGTKLVRKKSLSQNKKIYARFLCPNYILHWSECCKKIGISEINLREIVFMTINQQITLFTEIKNEATKISSSPKIKIQEQELSDEKYLIEQKIYKLKSLRSSMYDDFIDGLLKEKEYNYSRHKHEAESNVLTSRLSEITTALEKLKDDFISNKYDTGIWRLNNADELSQEVLTALVEKIIIYSNNIIEIKFKYQDEFEQLKKYVEENAII